MEEPLIAAATIEDVPQLVQLVNGAYRGAYSKKGWTTEADLLDGMRTNHSIMEELVQKTDAVILKHSNKGGVITGCVYLQKEQTNLYLGMLTVLPEMQASGIGKKLLQASEAFAIQQQCTAILMTVISVRYELIDWYRRRGYYPTGATEPFPNDPRFGIPRQPLEFVILKKDLQQTVNQ